MKIVTDKHCLYKASDPTLVVFEIFQPITIYSDKLFFEFLLPNKFYHRTLRCVPTPSELVFVLFSWINKAQRESSLQSTTSSL